MPSVSWKAHVHFVRHHIAGDKTYLLTVYARAAQYAWSRRHSNGPFERTFRVLDAYERFLRGALQPKAARIFRDWIEEARPEAERQLLGAKRR